jgi:hypothetical protein
MRHTWQHRLFFGIPYIRTIGFSLIAAIAMTAVALKPGRADTFIGVIWAFGMARHPDGARWI